MIGVVPALGGTAPAAAQTGGGQALTDKVSYGGNEVIRASGAITFLQGCKSVPEHLERGVDDIFQPWADLYIVPSGSLANGGALADISGAPNVIFGGLGGGFVEEIIGTSAPAGTIPAGVYDIVLDECQDGTLDPDDALMSEAFRVVIPLGTKPATVKNPDKVRAAQLAGDYAKLGQAWDLLLKAVAKKKVGGVSLGFASDMSIALVQIGANTSMPDPRPAASAALLQMGRRQAGLAADPPDPAFHGHAGLDAGTPITASITGDPVEKAVLDAARAQAIDGALIEALVTAVERHQGAAEVGNGDWMAAHARDAIELIDLIEARATITPDLIDAVWGAYLAQIFDIRSHVDQLLTVPANAVHDNGAYVEMKKAMNRGITREEYFASMSSLVPLRDAVSLVGNTGGTAFGANLAVVGDRIEAQALAFGDLRASLAASLGGLATEGRDAPRPTASAGGPYHGSVGVPVSLDASASSGTSPLSYAWDLDLDGVYDDASGPTPSHVPTEPGERIVAVEVTDADGATDVAFASVTVGVDDLQPVIAATTPTTPVIEGPLGSPYTASVEATDPEGQPVVIDWFRDGAHVGTGPTFTDTMPGDPGTALLDAVVSDPAGNQVQARYLVSALGPDADGDGWRVPGDCDDSDATIRPDTYPGEIVGNGKDDDCDPATPDEAQAARITGFAVNTNASPTGGWQEGDLTVMGSTWSHPLRQSGQEFTWTVDWHDGTTSEGVVSGTTHLGTEIRPDHVYRRSGRHSATLCITEPGGLASCFTARDIVYRTPALPAPPVVHPANLENWTSYDIGRPGETAVSGSSVWHIAPGGFSGIQETNRNFPNVLLSDDELDASVTGSARVSVDLGTIGADDDIIGFTIGLDEGEAERDDADWLSVQLAGHIGAVTPSTCGGTFQPHVKTFDPVVLIRFTGYPQYHELSGQTFDIADATDPLCRDDMGGEILASNKLPAPLGIESQGVWRRLVHPAYVTSPTTQIDQLYHAEIEVSPEQITVWINGAQVLHATAPPDKPFPVGRVGLLSTSQPDTRLIGHTQVPIVAAVQGTSETFAAPFADADLEGSHTAVIEWGDGTPASDATIEPVDGKPGFWTASADHAYATVGVHTAEVCVTDTEDLQVGCGMITVVVDDAPPVVDAGSDLRTVGPVSLSGATFSDPGRFDVQTATVEWGDGTPVAPATIGSFSGQGVIAADHTYDTPGSYEAEVCVASLPALSDDPLPGTGDAIEVCDTVDIVVTGPSTPQAYAAETVSGVEGDVVEVPVGFHDGARGQAHTVTVDWGDGTTTPASIVDAGVAGFGVPTHRYDDDGTYLVTATVCVTGDPTRCSTADSTVTVANAAPVLDPVVTVAETDLTHRIAVAFTDAGSADTHTATVDWGDGGGAVPATVTPAPDRAGGGTVEVAHTYSGHGSYTVEVCVTDDDGGTTCGQATITIATVPGAPTDVAAIGGDGNARVSWHAPDDGGSPIVDYEIEITPGGAIAATGSTAPSTVVRDLTNGVDHSFRVRAANVRGWGPWSAPSNVSRPRANCSSAPFGDVPANHPFCPEISWMAAEGISRGYGDNTYRPTVSTARQAMAAFLYRLAGSPDGPNPTCTAAPFRDVAVSHPFCAEISWMVRTGITVGYGDGTFRPQAPVARQAMAAFFQRFAGDGGDPTFACSAHPFTDIDPGHQFCAPIRWMRLSGMTEGFSDGTYRPTSPVSRQAMAAMVQRYFIIGSAP